MSLLSGLQLWKLSIPMQVTFRHAGAARSVTSSIWVEAKGLDGATGYGESCPRPYVTGEDLDSCNAFLLRHREDLLHRINSVDDVRIWGRQHQQDIDDAPAAWCAIELALLDFLARKDGKTLEGLLGLRELEGVFQYSAVLGNQSDSAFAQQLKQYLTFGFQEFKVKLSGDLLQDSAKFSLLQDQGIVMQHVRVDANNLWQTANQAESYLERFASSFFAIEEPLQSGDYCGMRQLAQRLGKVILLDESFLRSQQFSQIESDPQHWLINLRVSKMGGLLRSIEVARLACEKGIGLIIGAQVGETSLLTRAAISVASSQRSIVQAQEGAFGKLLLKEDVTDPPIAFGKHGQLVVGGDSQSRSPLKIQRPTLFLEEF